MLRKKKDIICRKSVFRRNILSRAFGLMFHSRIEDEAHIFIFESERTVALTMWFVFFPIDVLFLDEKKRIVEMKNDFRPFTNYYPGKQAMFVIELPAGTINGKKLKMNDVLDF